MLRNKIVYFKKIYKFGVDHFIIEVISFVSGMIQFNGKLMMKYRLNC